MVTKHKKVPFHVIRFLYKTEWGRLWQAPIDSHSTSACGLSWCRSPLPRLAPHRWNDPPSTSTCTHTLTQAHTHTCSIYLSLKLLAIHKHCKGYRNPRGLYTSALASVVSHLNTTHRTASAFGFKQHLPDADDCPLTR